MAAGGAAVHAIIRTLPGSGLLMFYGGVISCNTMTACESKAACFVLSFSQRLVVIQIDVPPFVSMLALAHPLAVALYRMV